MLLKMYEVLFLEAFSKSNDFIIDLPLANFQLFQNTQRKRFPFSLYLLNSEILESRAVALEKKGQFCKDLFWNFEFFKHPFLSEHFQNVSAVQSGSWL